jgi:hypothetical protein
MNLVQKNLNSKQLSTVSSNLQISYISSNYTGATNIENSQTNVTDLGSGNVFTGGSIIGSGNATTVLEVSGSNNSIGAVSVTSS